MGERERERKRKGRGTLEMHETRLKPNAIRKV